MQPLSAQDIRGTWGTLLLPLSPDESVDWDRLSAEIDCLLAAGVDGIYANGTACEFYAQSEAEFDRVHELLAAKCEAAGRPWQAGASHTSAQTMLDRVRRVHHLRPGAIQVILPDWIAVTDLEAVRFLERIAPAAAPAALVLYNPPHAKRNLLPAEFGVLARETSALAGVKVAHSGREWCQSLHMECPGVSLFVPGHELATGWSHGAHGSYSNVACLSPAGAVRWWKLMQRDLPAALAMEARIREFMHSHILPFRTHEGISNPGLDKLLAAIGGWCDIGTRLRWPYSWVPESEVSRLRAVARQMIPELFEDLRSEAS